MIRDVEVVNLRQKLKTGMSVADIARQTGYCEKTVRKWLWSESPPRYKRRPPRPGKLDPYKEYIMARIGDGVCYCQAIMAAG